MTNDSKREQALRMLRAFNYSLDQVMRHPLAALREWWGDGTGKYDYPPRRYTGGGRDPRG